MSGLGSVGQMQTSLDEGHDLSKPEWARHFSVSLLAPSWRRLPKELRQDSPDDLRIVLRDTVIHQGSDEAMRILEAARMQDPFEPALDALLERQPVGLCMGHRGSIWPGRLRPGRDGHRARPSEPAVFRNNWRSQSRYAADVEVLGIRQTPTFLLNGRQLENLSFESPMTEVRAAPTSAA